LKGVCVKINLKMAFPEFQKEYQKLNKAQKQAVDTIYGPLLVVAGPGSGKTQILSLRVANILQKTDTLAGNILCLTFTDSAAANMRERLRQIIGRDAFRVAIHTFHSFGVEIINRHPEFFYNGADFSPADELAQREILNSVVETLNYNDPLNKIEGEFGQTRLKSIKDAITDLKKGGLTPEEFSAVINYNEKELETLNSLFQTVFSDRISKKTITEATKLVAKIQKIKFTNDFPVSFFKPIHELILNSLTQAITDCATELTKPITAWKNKWLKRNENGDLSFTNLTKTTELKSLANIYKLYIQAMRDRGYFDFDDMLLDTIQAVQTNKVLAYELQEQYQFILVDEFQDTNNAQMRLLDLIAQSEISPNEPNLMAVGDDDQAIYKFQGAELSNILEFKDRYGAETIVMAENYRSTSFILDFAEKIIKQVEERLEGRIKGLNKKLTAVNPARSGGEITLKSFPTDIHEYHWIAETVQNLIAKNEPLNEIAIIAKEHKILRRVATQLLAIGISTAYEQQRNVLEQPHILQIVKISEFLLSQSDDHLPEIFSYPFWELNREEIWKISLNARNNKITWLEEIKNNGSQKFKDIANFLIELSSIAQYETLEHVLDELIGRPVSLMIIGDTYRPDVEQKRLTKFNSPFRDFYFGQDSLKRDPQSYLLFLSALRIFYSALKEYRQGELLKISDIVEFTRLRQKHKLPLADQTPFGDIKNAVNLLTAHKAKGQEFNSVFITSCQNEIWAKNRGRRGLSFPENLPITPAGDSQDDQLRLFYVAITRSKRNLFISAHQTNESGKRSSLLNFVPESFENATDSPSEESVASLESALSDFYRPPLVTSEKTLLRTYLENYKIKPTHLNNFLDISQGRGGPQTFFEQNILLFPQTQASYLSFGSAIHETIKNIYSFLKNHGELPEFKIIESWLESYLKDKRLNSRDFNQYFEKGKDVLKIYIERNKNNFSSSDLIEVDFNNQGVVLDNASLSGRIDKIKILNPGTVDVYDLKTGGLLKKWETANADDAVKAYKNKNQLGFYKLLIENSTDFSKYKVNRGILEFIETDPKENPILELEFDKDFIARLTKLIQVVYSKITNLDFPDVSKYSPDIKGIFEFEEELVNSK